MQNSNKKYVIWWIRNDLRIHDNGVLKAAIDSGKTVVPFYCFEESFVSKKARTWHFKFERSAIHRT
jgi:deoxyribodipyrimidine photolyase